MRGDVDDRGWTFKATSQLDGPFEACIIISHSTRSGKHIFKETRTKSETIPSSFFKRFAGRYILPLVYFESEVKRSCVYSYENAKLVTLHGITREI